MATFWALIKSRLCSFIFVHFQLTFNVMKVNYLQENHILCCYIFCFILYFYFLLSFSVLTSALNVALKHCASNTTSE